MKVEDRLELLRERHAALTRAFASHLPEKLDEIERGFQELLVDPARREVLETVHRHVHKLAGSGATFGMPRISALARELEIALRGLLEGGDAAGALDIARLGPALGSIREAARDAPGKAPRTEPAEEAAPAQKDERASLLIFVVDDDEDFARDLSSKIGYFGYRVRVFSQLRDLPDAMREERPSAVLMDLGFPEGDLAGSRTIASLRRDFGGSLPVVFVSSRTDVKARLSAVRGGADAYLTKPVDALALVDQLDRLTLHPSSDPLRVLIIDDDTSLADYYALMFADAGIRTETIADPLRVSAPLADFKPDLILMDLYLPGCTGVELAEVIRQEDVHVGIPIIFLSTETSAEKQADALGRVGDEFLTKPVDERRLVRTVKSRAERSRALRSLVTRDSLTGLINHTHVLSQLDKELERARRHGRQLAFAMVDLDEFKRVNDTYGHPAGDRVIKALARILQQGLRNGDVIGRYGGEEFAVVLPEVDGDDARRVLDDLRASFAQVRQHASPQDVFYATFSAGVAMFPEEGDTHRLVEAADRALYEAKRRGRNRIVRSGAE